MSDDVVIRVEGLWKRYGLPLPEVYYKGRRWLRSLRDGQIPHSAIRNPQSDGPWALRDINLEVKRGETLGIIGRNGAGKSTLLKVLAGVTPPTRGKIEVRGRVFPMIELNAGLHMELTGRENVRLLGAVMGLSRRGIEARMPEIEAFCELEEWFDKPVRMYSSGMLARLGFGVAMNVDADVLLIDEVLAVGDVGFQNRCLERMKEQRENGRTILFVSHALDMVQYLCRQVTLLDEGRIAVEGVPEEIITQYENLQYHKEARYVRLPGGATTSIDTARFELLSTRIRDSSGQTCMVCRPEEGFIVEFTCRTNVPIRDVIFTFALLNQRREICIWEYVEGSHLAVSMLSGVFSLRVHVPPVPLSGGLYLVGLMVRDRRSLEKLCHHKGAGHFVVEAETRERGMLTVPLHWECGDALEE